MPRFHLYYREIKSVFAREILEQYKTFFTGSVLRNFESALRTGNADLLQNTLRQYLLQSASCFDTAHENFYHGMLFGLLAVMSDYYYISSNRESEKGRFDIQLMPKDQNDMGYIIECKHGQDASLSSLQDLAQAAIDQIKERQYHTELSSHNIKQLGCFGLAFCDKQVAVIYDSDTL